jgi:hypothetical protein
MSQRAPHEGIVAFQGSNDEFEFVVADSGVGMLASLRRSPHYASFVDTGKALRLALTPFLEHRKPVVEYHCIALFH